MRSNFCCHCTNRERNLFSSPFRTIPVRFARDNGNDSFSANLLIRPCKPYSLSQDAALRKRGQTPTTFHPSSETHTVSSAFLLLLLSSSWADLEDYLSSTHLQLALVCKSLRPPFVSHRHFHHPFPNHIDTYTFTVRAAGFAKVSPSPSPLRQLSPSTDSP